MPLAWAVFVHQFKVGVRALFTIGKSEDALFRLEYGRWARIRGKVHPDIVDRLIKRLANIRAADNFPRLRIENPQSRRSNMLHQVFTELIGPELIDPIAFPKLRKPPILGRVERLSKILRGLGGPIRSGLPSLGCVRRYAVARLLSKDFANHVPDTTDVLL